MITNQRIDVGDVGYSHLSRVLRFSVAANSDAIRTIEDIVGRNDMSMEEIAEEMGKILEQAIRMGYTRGGMRRRFE
jgi:hypothetical protein